MGRINPRLAHHWISETLLLLTFLCVGASSAPSTHKLTAVPLFYGCNLLTLWVPNDKIKFLEHLL